MNFRNSRGTGGGGGQVMGTCGRTGRQVGGLGEGDRWENGGVRGQGGR